MKYALILSTAFGCCSAFAQAPPSPAEALAPGSVLWPSPASLQVMDDGRPQGIVKESVPARTMGAGPLEPRDAREPVRPMPLERPLKDSFVNGGPN